MDVTPPLSLEHALELDDGGHDVLHQVALGEGGDEALLGAVQRAADVSLSPRVRPRVTRSFNRRKAASTTVANTRGCTYGRTLVV